MKLLCRCFHCFDRKVHEEDLVPYYRAIPITSIVTALERGGIRTSNAHEYIKTAEIGLFHQELNQLLFANDDMDFAEAQRAAFKAVIALRKDLKDGATLSSAVERSVTRGSHAQLQARVSTPPPPPPPTSQALLVRRERI